MTIRASLRSCNLRGITPDAFSLHRLMTSIAERVSLELGGSVHLGESDDHG
jgi:hypothetical protein